MNTSVTFAVHGNRNVQPITDKSCHCPHESRTKLFHRSCVNIDSTLLAWLLRNNISSALTPWLHQVQTKCSSQFKFYGLKICWCSRPTAQTHHCSLQLFLAANFPKVNPFFLAAASEVEDLQVCLLRCTRLSSSLCSFKGRSSNVVNTNVGTSHQTNTPKIRGEIGRFEALQWQIPKHLTKSSLWSQIKPTAAFHYKFSQQMKNSEMKVPAHNTILWPQTGSFQRITHIETDEQWIKQTNNSPTEQWVDNKPTNCTVGP